MTTTETEIVDRLSNCTTLQEMIAEVKSNVRKGLYLIVPTGNPMVAEALLLEMENILFLMAESIGIASDKPLEDMGDMDDETFKHWQNTMLSISLATRRTWRQINGLKVDV